MGEKTTDFIFRLWNGRRGYLGLLAFVLLLHAIVPAARAADVRTVTRTCSISSDHPYWNSESLSWPVGEMGAMACRVNFSRLEVEDGYDWVILNSSYGETKITGSYPEGLMSEWVSGTEFTLRLVTNGYNTDYGFDAITYEIQVSAAWETFWIVAIPVGIALAVFFIFLECMRGREEPEETVTKGEKKR